MKSRSELTLGTNAPVTSAAHMVTVTLTNPAPLVMHVAAAQNSDVTGLPIYSPITAPRTRTARRYATGRPNGRRPARRHALPPIAWGTRRSLGTVRHPGPISWPLGSRNVSGRRQFGSVAAISRPCCGCSASCRSTHSSSSWALSASYEVAPSATRIGFLRSAKWMWSSRQDQRSPRSNKPHRRFPSS